MDPFENLPWAWQGSSPHPVNHLRHVEHQSEMEGLSGKAFVLEVGRPGMEIQLLLQWGLGGHPHRRSH